MAESDLDFYSVVRVIQTDATMELEIAGETGVIIGKTKDDDTNIPWYAVSVADFGSFMLQSADLEATGLRMRREDFYDGSSVVVRRDGTPRLD